MGLFSRRKGEPAEAVSPPKCVHVALIPHWDSVEAMGHEDQADKFACDACGADFTPSEAKQLRATEEARLHEVVTKPTD